MWFTHTHYTHITVHTTQRTPWVEQFTHTHVYAHTLHTCLYHTWMDLTHGRWRTDGGGIYIPTDSIMVGGIGWTADIRNEGNGLHTHTHTLHTRIPLRLYVWTGSHIVVDNGG